MCYCRTEARCRVGILIIGSVGEWGFFSAIIVKSPLLYTLAGKMKGG